MIGFYIVIRIYGVYSCVCYGCSQFILFLSLSLSLSQQLSLNGQIVRILPISSSVFFNFSFLTNSFNFKSFFFSSPKAVHNYLLLFYFYNYVFSLSHISHILFIHICKSLNLSEWILKMCTSLSLSLSLPFFLFTFYLNVSLLYKE